MELKTLGGLELVGSLAARPLSRPKPLLLLAYLAVEGTKERHHLAELFWPEAAQPMNSLRVALTQLRASAPGAIGATAGGAMLSAQLECDARSLLSSLDAQDGRRAKELYAGPFLGGFYLRHMSAELEEWVYATREFLARRFQHVLLQQAERLATEGAFPEAARVAADAFQATAEHDLDVMRRAYQVLVAGGHALAANVDGEARAYGVALDASMETARLGFAASTPVEVPNNLPSRLSAFVGRDPELVALGNLLSSSVRLVTLVGVGGVGKSRLALEAATAAMRDGLFPDGVFVVELAAVPEHGLVLDAIAAVVDAPEGGDILDGLKRALAGKRTLLVLDNFEHVVLAATQVSALLQAVPGLSAIVTSREPLDVTGEQLFRLESLAPPSGSVDEMLSSDPVALFRSVARRSDLSFEVNESNVADVLRVCDAVHRLPLGIELAASALSKTSLTELAQALEAAPAALVNDKRDAAPRHRSLAATIEHSWRLMSQVERQALERLSVFRGGFTREAAARVAGAGIATLGALTAKAMLRDTGSGRFDIHPLIRDHAAAALARDGNAAAEAAREHAEHFAELARLAEEPLKGADQAKWLTKLEDDLANLRAALTYLVWRDAGSHVESVRLALAAMGATWQFWLRRGRLVEGRSWYDAALAAPGATEHPELQAKALTGAAVLAFRQRDLEASERLNLGALEIRRRIGDRPGEARSLYNLAAEAGVRGDLDLAEERLTAAIAVFDEQDDTWSRAFALQNLATLQAQKGRLVEAGHTLRERLRLQRELGDEAGTGETLAALAGIQLADGDIHGAGAGFRQALEVALRFDDATEKVSALEGLAVVAHRVADPGFSARLLGKARAVRESHDMGATQPGGSVRKLTEELASELGERYDEELAAGAAMDERHALSWEPDAGAASVSPQALRSPRGRGAAGEA